MKQLRGLIVPAGLAVLVLCAVAAWHEPLIGFVVHAAGRSGDCTREASIDSLPVFNEQVRYSKQMRDASRRVKQDLEAGVELWRTPEGEIWVPVTTEYNELFYDMAEQHRGIYSRGGHGVKPGDVVLDCGANIGLYSKKALAAGAKKVIAIEPVPVNVECLRRNLAKEIADGRVVIVDKGVWDKDDWLEITMNATNWAGHSFMEGRVEGGRKLKLPLTTIDKLVGDLGLEKVDFIKMDIEGAERNALLGARETLKRDHPRMALCVYHFSDDPRVIPQRVMAAWSGYRQTCGVCEPGGASIHPQVYFYE